MSKFPEILLASQSPRRREILEKTGISFRIQPANTEESFPEGMDVQEIPIHISRGKAEAVRDQANPGEWILASDTVVTVEHDGKDVLLAKPEDAEDAARMLRLLSGRKHRVITGVVFLSADSAGQEIAFAETTWVHFRALSESDISWYVERYQPYDKAGAYAIQEGIGMRAIDRIEGCYYNVVGLPMPKLYQMMLERFQAD